MAKAIQPLLETLFQTDKPKGKTIVFQWRLIRRQGRPMLLLPEDGMDSSVALELYSAQRPLAKLWRAALPTMIHSPAATFFQRIRFEADIHSEFVRFLAAQSGVPAEQLRSPAIKFGSFGEKKIRLVLLACDQTDRPAIVIKVGLNAEGRQATEAEAATLDRLPANVIGCIRMCGQLNTPLWSAFATPFFPGKSPENDAGMEIAFHSWLNKTETLTLDKFSSWQELSARIPAEHRPKVEALTTALAGKQIHPTLHHGDFAPWNLRAINALNLQAYDWESGDTNGIPAWDWFHFVVQTSILVKRHSPERVAAELEQLIQSPRFFRYAQSAGIEKCIQPLLLGYLLHLCYIFKPMQGREVALQLFDLLWTLWAAPETKAAAKNSSPATNPLPIQNAGGMIQIKTAVTQLANLFWEPSLSHGLQPPLAKQIRTYWKYFLGALAWIVVVAQLPLLIDPHLMFAPFYLIPCVFVALRTERKLASLIAFISAFGGPLLFYWANPGFSSLNVILWNGLMRYVVFQIVVILFSRIKKQNLLRPPTNSQLTQISPIHALTGNWAVILLSLTFLMGVIAIDLVSGVNALMTGLYLIPCLLITLALDWRWGTALALLCAIVGPILQRPDPAYQSLEIQFWNTLMRFVMYEMVVVMVEKVRRESILFSPPKRLPEN